MSYFICMLYKLTPISDTTYKATNITGRKGSLVQQTNSIPKDIHLHTNFRTNIQPYMKYSSNPILSTLSKGSNRANRFLKRRGRVQDLYIPLSTFPKLSNNPKRKKYRQFNLYKMSIMLGIASKAYLCRLSSTHPHKMRYTFFHNYFCSSHLHTPTHRHTLPQSKVLHSLSRQWRKSKLDNSRLGKDLI